MTETSEKYNEFKILDIPDNTHYWFVRANSQAQYYDDFLLNNYIAVDAHSFLLKTLLDIPTTIRSSEDALIEKYKGLFQEHDLSLFEKRASKEEMSPTTKKSERTAELRRSSLRANRVFHFVEKFNIGDFVIVPYKSATKFLIGVIVSNCFESSIEHIEDLDENNESNYAISNFKFKRRVLWIKELPQRKFPEKLSWIRTAHQSLFDITDNADDINPFINPLYRYKGKTYTRIGVNTNKQISSDSWLSYQLMMKNILGDNLKNVYQKQYVQSPGDIVLYVEENLYWLLPLLLACLFGEVEFEKEPFKIKFQGVIRYFSKGERLKRKLQAKLTDLEVEEKEAIINNTDADTISKLDSKSIDPEVKKKVSDTSDSLLNVINTSIEKRNKDAQDRIESNFKEKEVEKNIDLPKDIKQTDIENIQGAFSLSNEDPGSLIQYETQEDNLNPSEDEHDKTKE